MEDMRRQSRNTKCSSCNSTVCLERLPGLPAGCNSLHSRKDGQMHRAHIWTLRVEIAMVKTVVPYSKTVVHSSFPNNNNNNIFFQYSRRCGSLVSNPTKKLINHIKRTVTDKPQFSGAYYISQPIG